MIKQLSITDAVDYLKHHDISVFLMGASINARNLYLNLTQSGIENRIRFWADYKYNFFRMYGLPVRNPDEVALYSYEAVIIADEKETAAGKNLIDKHIKKQLPVFCLTSEKKDIPDLPFRDLKYTDEPLDEKSLMCISPTELINENRLDIIIRYMACKEILLHTEAEGMKMYRKLIKAVNGEKEFIKPFIPSAYFSAYSQKCGIEAFIDSFALLTESMRKNGFDKKHFIPVTESSGIINGTHRIAAALALGKSIYIKKYVGFGGAIHLFDRARLKEKGFTDRELNLIYKEFLRVKNTSDTLLQTGDKKL